MTGLGSIVHRLAQLFAPEAAELPTRNLATLVRATRERSAKEVLGHDQLAAMPRSFSDQLNRVSRNFARAESLVRQLLADAQTPSECKEIADWAQDYARNNDAPSGWRHEASRTMLNLADDSRIKGIALLGRGGLDYSTAMKIVIQIRKISDPAAREAQDRLLDTRPADPNVGDSLVKLIRSKIRN